MRVVRLLALLCSIALAGSACAVRDETQPSGNGSITQARELRKSDVRVEGEGVVTRVLADDRQGSRHQRFIVRVDGNNTVLISHNIDLAPRVDGVREGDTVNFAGEYVWNEQGGVVHWTHADPANRHPSGWILHKGRTYR